MSTESRPAYKNMSIDSSVARSGLGEESFQFVQETAYRQLFEVKPYQYSHLFTSIRYFADKDTGRLTSLRTQKKGDDLRSFYRIIDSKETNMLPCEVSLTPLKVHKDEIGPRRRKKVEALGLSAENEKMLLEAESFDPKKGYEITINATERKDMPEIKIMDAVSKSENDAILTAYYVGHYAKFGFIDRVFEDNTPVYIIVVDEKNNKSLEIALTFDEGIGITGTVVDPEPRGSRSEGKKSNVGRLPFYKYKYQLERSSRDAHFIFHTMVDSEYFKEKTLDSTIKDSVS